MFAQSSIIVNLLFIFFLVFFQNLLSSLADLLIHLYTEIMIFMILIPKTNRCTIWKWISSYTLNQFAMTLIFTSLHRFMKLKKNKLSVLQKKSNVYDLQFILKILKATNSRKMQKCPHIITTFKIKMMCNIKISTCLRIMGIFLVTQLHLNGTR